MIQLLQPILHHELKGFRLGYFQVEILLARWLRLLSRLDGNLTLGDAGPTSREPCTLMWKLCDRLRGDKDEVALLARGREQNLLGFLQSLQAVVPLVILTMLVIHHDRYSSVGHLIELGDLHTHENTLQRVVTKGGDPSERLL
jgi:hypothetical protein